MTSRSKRVYIAAPKQATARALAAAAALRAGGATVVSTWHDTYDGISADPPDYSACRRIMGQNLLDMAHASYVLALTDKEHGRECYVEIGRALAEGRTVVFSAQRGGLPISWTDNFAFLRVDDVDAVAFIVGHA